MLREGDRLPFRLNEFIRFAWSGSYARRVWSERITRTTDFLRALYLTSVAAGNRSIAIMSVSPAVLPDLVDACSQHGLALLSLGPEVDTQVSRGDRPVTRVVIGKPNWLDSFQSATVAGDERHISELLGYPRCCSTFISGLTADCECIDATFATAANTEGAILRNPTHCEFRCPAGINTLLRRLGVSLIPFHPCAYHCPAALECAEEYLAIARSMARRELTWLLEMLSWPVEWSALHGIAEIMTPVIRFAVPTDSTSVKYVATRISEDQSPHRLDTAPRPLQSARPLTRGSAGRRQRTSHLGGCDDRECGDILEETLADLEAAGAIANREIREVHLNTRFTVVRLDDDSVGACMSYYYLQDEELRRAERILLSLLAEDPLLLNALFADGWPAVLQSSSHRFELITSLRATLLSALSVPLLRDADASRSFHASSTCDIEFFGRGTTALVIGFGGYLETLATLPHIAHLHIADLTYHSRRTEMDTVVARFGQHFPTKRITISDGSDTEARLRDVELVAITGSTLCNGSLERLLDKSCGCNCVVLQGQSASMYPMALFRRGVDIVSTSVKDLGIAAAARADKSGAELLQILERGLPQLYMWQRASRLQR